MNKTIAYFSAEYSVADSLPIYAGGLGILAGDTVQEAGAEGKSFYALGLVYHEAFTAGEADTRPMTERLRAEGFQLLRGEDGKLVTARVRLGDETVAVQAWRKQFGSANLLLLDTRVHQNSEATWHITDRLYDSAPGVMLRQQLVLGFGGIALLEALNVTVSTYHLNEGHMAFAGLAAAVQYQKEHPKETLVESLAAMKPHFAATKHTILPGAGLTLSRDDLQTVLGPVLRQAHGSVEDLFALGGKPDGYFSTTRFLLGLASHHSGVSAIHVAAEAAAHPGSPLITTTNGVFAPRWRAHNLGEKPLALADETLWQKHVDSRRALLEYVKQETGKTLNPDALTVVWARRMTAYKRPELLVSHLDRLAALAHQEGRPMQFVVAGKANPADATGIELMERVIAASKQPDLANSLAYLPHYNPMTARLLVQGADLWLNTPIRGMEACGTSGMKASLNGALQFSTSDGWIDEIDATQIGWVLPVEQSDSALYVTLGHDIASLFYEQEDGLPKAWIAKMRANIELIEKQFTSTRMLKDYYEKLYQ
jgi:starch phosphorylase